MRKLFVPAVLFAVVGAAHAGARDELATFTNGLKGLDGQFAQQVFDGKGKPKENSSGEVSLSKPNLFRWEYRKPYAQLIVADGRKIWNYEPDLQQASVREQSSEEQGSPLAVLLDPASLEKRFDVAETGQADGLDWLTLKPKNENDASFQFARLGFGKNGLQRMEIVDAVGQRTRIDFDGWKRNPSFTKDQFRFVPPSGVDVVGQ